MSTCEDVVLIRVAENNTVEAISTEETTEAKTNEFAVSVIEITSEADTSFTTLYVAEVVADISTDASANISCWTTTTAVALTDIEIFVMSSSVKEDSSPL